MELKYNFEGVETRRFKIDEGYDDMTGDEGDYFGIIWVGDQKYAIVQFDGAETPSIYVAEALLIEQKSYYTLKNL